MRFKKTDVTLKNVSGEGDTLYAVLFTDSDGETDAEEIGLEFWLAKSPKHLKDQVKDLHFDDGIGVEIFEEELWERSIVYRKIGNTKK